MKKYFICLVLIVIFTQSNAFSQAELAEKLKTTVQYLASDELEGRYAGTEGIEKAAKFIENLFAKSGLKMFGNSFRHPFDVPIELKLDSSSFLDMSVIVPKLGVPNDKIKPRISRMAMNSEWLHLGISKTGTASGELAFVGYGITAKDLNYDDYDGIDVKGKIVICLTNSPDGEKRDGKFSGHLSYTGKTQNAATHGALAVIFVKIQGDSANKFENFGYHFNPSITIPIIQANRTAISKYFPRNSELVNVEKEINTNKKPKSFVLPNMTCNLNLVVNLTKVQTANIYGYFEGSDPTLKNEYVVVGAHYDHLGNHKVMGSKSDKIEIHNGADDNASGTTAMLELMERFSKEKPKRSVIFISFAAEEMGLLGSKDFIANPPIKLESVASMLNLDMVGMSRKDSTEVWGLGTAEEFDAIVVKATDTQGLKITKVQTGMGPSDHSSFAKKDIPVLMFFTGFHPNYHKPSDDWDKLNYESMAKIVNASEDIVKFLVSMPKPKFKEVKK